MNAIKVLSIACALSAALIALAAAPAARSKAPLLADGVACDGSGKACTHDQWCEEECKDAAGTCCQVGDTWSFYPAEQ